MAERVTGTVKFYLHRKGYGFIIPNSDPGNKGIFVHRSDIHRRELAFPKPGEEVTYVVSQDASGRPKAAEVERPNGIPFVKKPRAPSTRRAPAAKADAAPKVAAEGQTQESADKPKPKSKRNFRRRRNNNKKAAAPAAAPAASA